MIPHTRQVERACAVRVHILGGQTCSCVERHDEGETIQLDGEKVDSWLKIETASMSESSLKR